jgi:hypothetical protein
MTVLLFILIASSLRFLAMSLRKDTESSPFWNLVAGTLSFMVAAIIGTVAAFDLSSKFKTTATVTSVEQEFCVFSNAGSFWRVLDLPDRFNGNILVNCQDQEKIVALQDQGFTPVDDDQRIGISLKTQAGEELPATMLLPKSQIASLRIGDQLDVWAQALGSSSRTTHYAVKTRRFDPYLMFIVLGYGALATWAFVGALLQYRNRSAY